MRNFYFAIFVLSVFFLAFCNPVPSELTLTDKLALHPESWAVSLNGDPKMFRNATDEDAKARILAILRTHRSSDIDWHFASIFIACAVFSFVGWRREIWFSKSISNRKGSKVETVEPLESGQ